MKKQECVLLDTSFFIRLLNPEEKLHNNAVGHRTGDRLTVINPSNFLGSLQTCPHDPEDGLLQLLPPEVEVEAELDKVLDEEDIY